MTAAKRGSGPGTLEGSAGLFEMVNEGSGPKMSPDDVAVIHAAWTQGPRSVDKWITIDAKGGELDRVCGSDALPTSTCNGYPSSGPGSFSPAMRSALRKAFAARGVGSEARLGHGAAGGKEWSSWLNSARVTLNGGSLSRLAAIDGNTMGPEPLSVAATLGAALLPALGDGDHRIIQHSGGQEQKHLDPPGLLRRHREAGRGRQKPLGTARPERLRS